MFLLQREQKGEKVTTRENKNHPDISIHRGKVEIFSRCLLDFRGEYILNGGRLVDRFSTYVDR